jgi:hypothetical protein
MDMVEAKLHRLARHGQIDLAALVSGKQALFPGADSWIHTNLYEPNGRELR